MHMTFWWSSIIKDFIFPGYNIKTVLGLTSTCLGLGALAVFFEWLRLMQARIRQKELFIRARQIRTICPPSESVTLLFDSRSNGRPRPDNITCFDKALLFIWDALVWFNLQILSYLLMLVVMVYNGWMTIALILGSALGYFIFGPSFMKINLENCQAMRDAFCSLTCGEPEQPGETTPALHASTSAASISHINTEVSACIHNPPSEEQI